MKKGVCFLIVLVIFSVSASAGFSDEFSGFFNTIFKVGFEPELHEEYSTPNALGSIVFIHGLFGNRDVWKNVLPDYFGEEYNIFTYEYPTHDSYKTHAMKLAELLKDVRGKIYLVGKSMGGLVARESAHYGYVNNFGIDVKKVILIGTPNSGSPIAGFVNAVEKIFYGGFWANPESVGMLESGDDVRRIPGVEYYAIAGVAKDFRLFDGMFFGEDNDDTVSFDSAIFVGGDELKHEKIFIVSGGHNSLQDEDSSRLFLKEIIGN